MTREECEAMFLKNNLFLLAEKMKISSAEALVLQAKLWQNPVFSVEEVNFWAGKQQLDVFGQEVKGFFGSNFGRNRQAAVSLEQLILTAGKRDKAVAVQVAAVEIEKMSFEEALRNLKSSLRIRIAELNYHSELRRVFENQIFSVKKLISAYKSQVEKGNIPKGELIRLKALEMEIQKQIYETDKVLNEVQNLLCRLMSLPPNSVLKIETQNITNYAQTFRALSLQNLINSALENRPEIKTAKAAENYQKNILELEKAKKVPDLVLKANYDRAGNFMYNFIGFGIAAELPFFNKNQGNIKFAEITLEKTRLDKKRQEYALESEVTLAFKNFDNALRLYLQAEPDFEQTLDLLLESYTKNFANRNIDFLEYFDFLSTYLENKRIIIEGQKELREKAEALNFAVGNDIF
jgi:cobalt-zinc-cadmium efflux system outer membrane protein